MGTGYQLEKIFWLPMGSGYKPENFFVYRWVPGTGTKKVFGYRWVLDTGQIFNDADPWSTYRNEYNIRTFDIAYNKA